MPSRPADQRRPSASQSFTPKEVAWLKQLFAIMARGGDVSVLRRAPQYASVFRKVARMEQTVERKQLELLKPPEEQTN